VLWYSLGTQAAARRELGWVTRDGKYSPLDPAIAGFIPDVSLSPDGTRVAFTLRADDGIHVWSTQFGSRNRTRLTFEGAYRELSWHPNGKVLIINRPPGQLLTLNADGSSPPVVVDMPQRVVRDANWSRDGSRLFFVAQGANNNDIFSRSMDSTTRIDTLVASNDGETHPSVSPDGRWLLFQVSRGPVPEIFVRPYPNTSRAVYQVSSAGGSQPTWSRDGREIFYRNRTDSLVAVPVLSGDGFPVGEARTLFSVRDIAKWQVDRDASRFLVMRVEMAAPERFVFVENYHEELKARMKQ
jgi:WD40 repeat protein